MKRLLVISLTLLFFAPLLLAQAASPRSSALGNPLNMTQVWNLDATYTDRQHGVTFRYPSVWNETGQFAYHAPALTTSQQDSSLLGFGYSEGGFPRTSIVGPYSQTNLEGFGVVYSAVPVNKLAECKRLARAIARTPKESTIVLGGRSFSVYETGEAGMSQFIYGKLYVTYAGNTCYRFETDVAAADADTAEVKALTPAQYRSIDEHLLEIMKSVRIPSVDKKNRTVWLKLQPQIEAELARHQMVCDSAKDREVRVADVVELTGDGVPEAAIDWCNGGAYTSSLILMRLEEGRPVLARSRKNGRFSYIELASGSSVKHSVSYEFHPDQRAIYIIVLDMAESTERAVDKDVTAHVDVLVWNAKSKTFDWNGRLSKQESESRTRKSRKP